MLPFITIATSLVPDLVKVPRVAADKAETVATNIANQSKWRTIALRAVKAADLPPVFENFLQLRFQHYRSLFGWTRVGSINRTNAVEQGSLKKVSTILALSALEPFGGNA
jgi:hypothetical protein